MNIKQRVSKKRLDVHICELPKTSESNLPKLPPSTVFYLRWRRNFQKLFIVSADHPFTRLHLRSHAAISFEKRRHGRSSFWWVIHPCSKMRYYWNIMMAFVYLYMFTTVPYIFAFQRVAKNSGPEIWELVYPACIICIIDIALNFITGFTSKDGPEIFLDPSLVVRNYLRRYFVIDFISSIPYTWFYKDRIQPPGQSSNSFLLVLESLLLLKIVRIYTLRFYIKQIIACLSMSHVGVRITWIIIMMILIFHWCSCLTHVYPFIALHIAGKTKENSDMYYMVTELYETSDWHIYLIYYHLGMSNFFGSSFKEFLTLGKSDTEIRCILLLFGKGYVIYIMVMVLQLVQSAAEPELKYQRIMHCVNEYINEKKLPEKLKNRLILYYEYRYQGSYFKENAISSTLSSHLNQEIIIHSSRGLLDTATILHYLPHNVIGNLMGLLKPVIYLNNDIIYKCETDGDCMFFIINGTVALITFNGTEICHEQDGGYFGEAALIFPDRKRLESVIALEVCELLRLNRRDFKRIFSPTSTFYKRLEKVAKERQEQIGKLTSFDKEATLEKNGSPNLPTDAYSESTPNDILSNDDDDNNSNVL